MRVPDLTFTGNPAWLVALAVAVAIGLGLAVLRPLIAWRLAAVAERPRTRLDEVFLELAARTHRLFIFILFGSDTGTVEYIGLKTTRLRASTGEQIVCSNADLLQSRIYNDQDRRERRVVFGTVYQTPPDKVAAIPDMVREIIEAQPATRFERGHVTGFGDSSFDFEFVDHMEVPDTATYMDARQAINLGILRRFEADGIAFAYPTRTLFVERGEESPES